MIRFQTESFVYFILFKTLFKNKALLYFYYKDNIQKERWLFQREYFGEGKAGVWEGKLSD